MKPQWDGIVKGINEASKVWGQVQSKLQDPLPLPGPPGSLSHESITRTLAECVALITQISQRNDINGVFLQTYEAGIQSNVGMLVPIIGNLNTGPDAVKQLSECLARTVSSLPWLLPSSLAGTAKKKFADAGFQAKVTSLDSLVLEVQELHDKAEDAADQGAADLLALNKTITTLQEEANKLLQQIRAHEREISTAMTNAQGNAKNASSAEGTINGLIGELSAGLESYKKLDQQITALRDQADAALRGASRVGLAKSFADRRQSLDTARKAWFGLFAFALLCLVFGTGVLANEIMSLNPNSQPSEYVKLVIHLLIGFPFIWVAWFAVRQFGRTARLSEDYAFKEAVAMSFAGYAKEMGADPEMLKKLQQTAIDTFGANPIRVLSESEPVSPAHDLVSTLMDKAEPNKVLEFMTALVTRSKD
ncbi:MAG TPA: hypothetical protein VF651_06415 [Gammaproteobacteria bacterium]